LPYQDIIPTGPETKIVTTTYAELKSEDKLCLTDTVEYFKEAIRDDISVLLLFGSAVAGKGKQVMRNSQTVKHIYASKSYKWWRRRGGKRYAEERQPNAATFSDAYFSHRIMNHQFLLLTNNHHLPQGRYRCLPYQYLSLYSAPHPKE
jgi:hypothetical protein